MLDINVKNPSAKVADFHVSLEETKTVGQLKQYLNVNYPGNPPSERQKLIFAGKLLNNNEITLGEVFKQNDIGNVQTIHIVVSKVPSSPTIGSPQVSPFQTQQIPTRPNFPNIEHQQQQLLQQQFIQQQILAAQQFAAFQQQLHAAQMARQNVPHQPAQRAEEPQPHRESIIWLIVKLTLMVYLFSQGGSTTRTILLSIGALFIFLYQAKVLRFAMFSVQQQQNVVPVGERGFINELILPFFYSLVPIWQPNSQQEAAVPPQPPVDQAVN